MFVGIVAGEEEQPADADLDIGRIELRLQLRDLLLKIFCRRFCVGEFQHQLLSCRFQLVEDREPRAAFGVPALDLLHEALLGCLDRRKLGVQRIFVGGRTASTC